MTNNRLAAKVVTEVDTPETMYRCIGMAALLASDAERLHKHTIADFVAQIVHPLRLGQFRIYLDRAQKPIGAFTWAWLSEAAERRFLERHLIAGEDWRSGTRLWIIDAIARPSFGRAMFRDLRDQVFADQDLVRAKRLQRSGPPRVIVYRRGEVPFFRETDLSRD